MARYARIVDDVVVEVPMLLPADTRLEEAYHPDIVADCEVVPKAVQVGWVRGADGKFSASPAAKPDRDELASYAKILRDATEAAGITVNGMAVASDPDSQTRVANAYAGMQATGASSIRFKASAGFIDLDVEQVKAVGAALFAHTQACFAAEDAVGVGLDASPPTITARAQVEAAFAAVPTSY